MSEGVNGIPIGSTTGLTGGLPVGQDQYLSLTELAKYCSLCRRTLQDLLDDLRDPLPSYRVGRKLLVRRSEFDAWMIRHRNDKAQALAQLAAADARALLTTRNNSVNTS